MNEPKPPLAVGIELIQDLSSVSQPVSGYLRRHRHRVKTALSDGSRTDTYVVDFVDRAPEQRDAMVVLPWERGKEPRVLLRRQVRYAAYLVAGTPLTVELIAGLMEHGESAEECATRELWEEAGLVVERSSVKPLGKPFFILPGIFTERIWPATVEVPEGAIERVIEARISGDGSPYEEGAEQIAMTLSEAFALMDRPIGGDQMYIADAKTELCLHRLRALIEGR